MEIVKEIVLHLVSIVEFVFIGVIVKYIIARWFAHRLGDVIKWLVIRSDRHMAIWLHNKKHALGEGHRRKQYYLCRDEACADL